VKSHELGAPAWSDADRRFMRLALALASRSAMREVPVGAVLVSGGEVLGEGWNHPISSHDPTLHAEIDALRQAAAFLGNYRLPGSTLYVTLEPCIMCVGALVQARVDRLVFGTRDLRFGAVRTKFRLADSDLLNHRAKVEEGLFAAESTALLAQFFAARRKTGGSK
jgi:tRNA(adenine34) deaminase